MVTIANYLNGNFATKQTNELERPICILQGTDSDTQVLWNYSTNRNLQNQRNVVIVDFGIAWTKVLAAKNTDFLKEKRKVVRINQAHNQHVILPGRSSDCLRECIALLEQHSKTHNLPDFLLFVQGFLVVELFHSQSQIEQFIAALSTINPAYKQVNILANQGLNKSTKYNLERLSTCIVNINKRLDKPTINQKEGKWEASMVVRRYTGFSHQEDYQIQVKEGKLQVERLKRQTEVQQEQSHLQGMGFTVKKSTKTQELQAIKSIIYPYLNKQTCSSCKNADCECKQPELTIDDEQEQDDDVDV